MSRLEFEDLNEAISYFAKELIQQEPIKSTNVFNKDRYKKQLGGELTQQFFIIKDATKVLSTLHNHKYYKWWMYGEILTEMLNLDPPIMYKYKPELYDQHYDRLEDGRMQYSYSSRFVEFNQLVNVYRKLKKNPNSKRCMISIYTPYDTSNDRHDAPCTTAYQLIHRDGKLNMTVFYRSWDFFGGFKTYDFALSSFILQAFCSWLNMEPGQLGFYANSLHFYERDREQLQKLEAECECSQNKISNSLIVDKNVYIKDFYEQLRFVKLIEEAAFSRNFTLAENSIEKLDGNIFKDIANTFIEKNEKEMFKK